MKLNNLIIAATALLFVSGVLGCGSASETEDLIGGNDTTVDTVGDVPVQDNGRPDVVTPDIETPDVTDVAPEDIQVSDIPGEDVPVADVPLQDIPEDDVLCLNDDGSLCCDGFADCIGRLLGEGEDPCHPAICEGGACVVSSGVACNAIDACHLVGTCNPATGQCDNPKAIDGALCPDGTCQDGVCIDKCIDVVCEASDECHAVGTCDHVTGLCSDPAAVDGTSCTEGACQDGVCTNMCPFPCIVLIDACVDTLPCDIHTGECATAQSEDGTACAWDGTCADGNCIAIQNGLFQNNGYWTPTNGASVNTTLVGNGNSGGGSIPGGGWATLSQTLTVLPNTLRLKAGFDVMGDCGSLDMMECIMHGLSDPAFYVGGVLAVRGFANDGMWSSFSSCLGESAYGSEVDFTLRGFTMGVAGTSIQYDNVWLDVVDEETCPAVGTFLNGDMQGTFGWAPCSATTGSISYGLDGVTPYVQISGIGAQNDITCMKGWFSAPLATTMAHQALKFAYRSGGRASGGYDFIAQTPAGAMQYLDYDTSSWKEVIRCIPADLAGRAEIFQFSRGGRWNGDNDFVAIKDARIESDAVACP